MSKKALLLAALAAATTAAPAVAEPLNYNVIEFAESASAEVQQDTMIIGLEVNRAFMQKYNTLNRHISANKALKSELQGRRASPLYQYKNGKQTQIGWQESAQIRVDSTDFTAINQLVAQAQNDAALQYTQFSVSKKKREAVIDEVSKAALKRFQARADTLVQTLGFRGYKIVRLNLGQIGNQSAEYAAAPQAMMMRAAKADSMGGMPETTNPGTEEIRITVNGTIQM